MLGTCDKCKIPLCVVGAVVCCQSCGHPHPDHPMMKTPAPPARPWSGVIPPQEYASTVPDRVTALEKQVADLRQRLERQEAAAAASEARRLAKAGR